MITLTASADFGYGGKQYIARVTGRDPKWGMRLEFIGSKGGKRDETTTATVDEPGLYKVRGWSRKYHEEATYYIIFEVDGELKRFACKESDASKISKAIVTREFREIVTVDPDDNTKWIFQTERQAEKAAVAATIDAAVEACWQVIQGLPEKEAAKVIAALKKRATPPKPAPAVGLREETPVGIVSDANADLAGVSEQRLGLTPTPVA
jgi:hypothetical protein